MENQDSTSNDVINFPDERKYLQTISKANDSQPTKTKVAAFKTRVLKLIKMYAEKSPTLNPLLDSFNQQLFSKQPQKMNQIALLVLNKQNNLEKPRLSQLLDIYKTLLLFKAKNQNTIKLCETFVRILKKLMDEDGQKIIQQMLEIVFMKRSCKLNVTFFQYLIRKIPTTKKIILQGCSKLMKNAKIRQAQLKQLQKLRSKIKKQKHAPIKKQQDVYK